MQMMPQVSEESGRNWPVAGEVDPYGRRSTQLRSTKKLVLNLKVGSAPGFLHDEEHTSSLAFT